MYEKLNQYDVTCDSVDSLNQKFLKFKASLPELTAFLGFDGYIDSLYSLVKRRINSEEWIKLDSMKSFGELLIDIAGSSGNIERVLKKKVFGGFAPNTSRAMNALGVHTYLIGALGLPGLNKIYEKQPHEESYSIAQPGETLGLEFDDGKIMITDFEPILNIDWKTLTNKLPPEMLIRLIENVNVMGFGHWALIPKLNQIWERFISEIFPCISNLKKKLFFVDIADIRKRSHSDIQDLIRILQNIDSQIPVMLSANDQEADLLSKFLQNVKEIDSTKANFKDYVEGGKNLNKEINLSYLVIHSPHFATISTKKDHFWVTEGYTSKPKYTVAAGDHFHTGVALGLANSLTPSESVVLGNALTAIFVRTGISPNIYQLSEFIRKYMDYIFVDNPLFT